MQLMSLVAIKIIVDFSRDVLMKMQSNFILVLVQLIVIIHHQVLPALPLPLHLLLQVHPLALLQAPHLAEVAPHLALVHLHPVDLPVLRLQVVVLLTVV